MEISLNVTREEAEEIRQSRLAAGAVEISQSALLTALAHIRAKKELAIDNQLFESAAEWRDNEKNVIAALAGLGLAKPEVY
jgi:hypothetical protein